MRHELAPGHRVWVDPSVGLLATLRLTYPLNSPLPYLPPHTTVSALPFSAK